MNSLTALVHGPSKAGKSLFAASTPAPRVIFDCEAAARFLPVRQPLEDDPQNPGKKRPKVWHPEGPPPEYDGSWDTVVIPVNTWQTALAGLAWLQRGSHPFRSAVVDSASELQVRALEKVAGRNQVKLQDWGTVLREMRGFLSDLRDLTTHPVNPLAAVVVTSMSKVENDGRAYPWLQGQMKTVIPYLFDVIAYIDAIPNDQSGIEERFIYTRKTKKYLAGERVNGRIPPILQLPIVSGSTLDEVASKNTAFQSLIDLVYAMHDQVMESPAVVDTEDSPFAYRPQAEDGIEGIETAANKES